MFVQPFTTHFRFKSMQSSPARRVAPLAASVQDVWALDFDGVLCDSVGESSLSAIRAAEELWPSIFATPTARARRDELVEKMRAVRPVIETGYENIIQIRLLFDNTPVDQMLSEWHTMLPAAMKRYDCDRADLVKRFGATRDAWIATDIKGWLAPNRFYPGTIEPLRRILASPGRHDAYIVTTKQARFTAQLLHDMARVPFPAERIYSQTESGEPKTKRLAQIASDLENADASVSRRYHFIEDKLSALEKVSDDDSLHAWNLYLVDWGYNTPQERERARRNKRIRVIQPDEFGILLDKGKLD